MRFTPRQENLLVLNRLLLTECGRLTTLSTGLCLGTPSDGQYRRFVLSRNSSSGPWQLAATAFIRTVNAGRLDCAELFHRFPAGPPAAGTPRTYRR